MNSSFSSSYMYAAVSHMYVSLPPSSGRFVSFLSALIGKGFDGEFPLSLVVASAHSLLAGVQQASVDSESLSETVAAIADVLCLMLTRCPAAMEALLLLYRTSLWSSACVEVLSVRSKAMVGA